MNFVTGGTGMLGAHLIGELLKRHLPVCAGYRSLAQTHETLSLLQFHGFSKIQLDSIQWRMCDVLDTDSLVKAFDGCDRVFHTAAIVSYHAHDREAMYETNVQGTANVVNVALQLGNIKIIHISSIASLGKSTPGQTLDENTEWKNSALNTHYGITKHLADLEIWRGVQEGISALIVHPGFIIGAGSFQRSSPSVFKKLDEGLAFYPPGGTGFIAAKDCAMVTVELALSAHTNDNYILVSSSETMQWLFSRVAKSISCTPPRFKASKGLMHAARLAEWLVECFSSRKALITRETVKNASIQFAYNNQKLLRSFPQHQWNLEGAIDEAGHYYRQKFPLK